MAQQIGKLFPATLPDSADFPYRFFCQLFDDMIIRNVCLLRRSELNNKKPFTCQGCSKDRLLNAMNTRRSTLTLQR